MSASAIQRCPRCGNENSGDSYACSFCGKRLRIERIEKIPFFKRIEEDWFNPYPWYLKIIYLIINPSFEISMFLIGIIIHIYIDKFMFEENIWW